MKLVRCPKCNRRDTSEVRGFFFRSLALGTALGALLALVMYGLGGPFGAAAAAALGLGGGLARFYWKLAQSDRVVHFEAQDDLTRL